MQRLEKDEKKNNGKKTNKHWAESFAISLRNLKKKNGEQKSFFEAHCKNCEWNDELILAATRRKAKKEAGRLHKIASIKKEDGALCTVPEICIKPAEKSE
ncbi:hypothetical protein ACFL29_01125 [Patescibacteria group bacterium]